jgi:hypothetical protein
MQSLGSKLSRKVKTPYHPIANDFNKDKYFAVIYDTEYNVIYIDSDNYFIYWYLEKVGGYDGNRIEPEGEETVITANN